MSAGTKPERLFFRRFGVWKLTWLSKDRHSARRVTMKDLTAGDGDFISVAPCEYCGDLVRISDENRSHILEDCRAAATARAVIQETSAPSAKRPPTLNLVDRYYALLKARIERRGVEKEVTLSPGSPAAAPFVNVRKANAADSEVT